MGFCFVPSPLPLVLNVNSAYTISFPSGEKKMGNRGLILTLVPLFVTKKSDTVGMFAKDRSLVYKAPAYSLGASGPPTGELCSCAAHSAQTTVLTPAGPLSE